MIENTIAADKTGSFPTLDVSPGAGKWVIGDKPETRKILDCMHCGFCLPTCPTYILTGDERSSPRGRIALMREIDNGRLPISSTFDHEMFFCLGCLACTTACPAGVDYSHLIERSRAQVMQARPGSPLHRFQRGLVFSLFEHLGWLRFFGRLFRLYQWLGLQALARKTGLLRLFPGKLADK